MTGRNRHHRHKPIIVGNNSIAEGRSAGEPSAVIQIDDINGGFLTSRLTQVQRDAIENPADGLMIWNTDTNQMELFATGTNWGSVSSGGGGGGGAVGTVFGRTGNVIAVAGDYTAALITNVPSGNLTSTDVQSALNELQTEINGLGGAVVATAVTSVPSGNLAAANVQAALNELQGDIDTINATTKVDSFAGRNGVVVPATSDYDAIQIDVTPTGGLVATNVQAALGELQAEILALAVNDLTDVDTNTSAPSNGDVLGWDGTNWVPSAATTVDLNFTVSDETGNDAAGAPLNAPVIPDTGDVHLEIYDDFLVWWSWSGTAWTNSGQIATNPALATAVSPAADGATGVVGTSVAVAREDHKHPAQGVSADTDNRLIAGTDGLHFVTDMVGADGTSAGSAGVVPAPAATDDVNFLRGDGTWVEISANDRVHADDTTVAPALVGTPTVVEIQAFVTGGTITDTVVYYTGDDLPASAPTYVYAVDASGTVTEIQAPISTGTTPGINDVLEEDQALISNQTIDTQTNTLTVAGIGAVGVSNYEFGPNNLGMRIQDIATGDLENSLVLNIAGAAIGHSNSDTSETFEMTATGAGIGFNIDDGGDFRVNNDAGNAGEVLVSQGSALPPVWTTPTSGEQWTRITAAATLDVGNYALDSTTAGFTLLLTEEVGEWEFGDHGFALDTNNVIIGTAAQTFTDANGAQVAGPVTLDENGTTFKLVNTDGSTDFLLIKQPVSTLTTNVVVNGSWNASTNTPDLTLAVNQGDGVNVFTYLITTDGTQDIGQGSTDYALGGQITFFDQPGGGAVFRYDAPAALRDRVFADDTAVAPAIAGSPTVAEITVLTAADEIVDTVVYYNGSDISGATATHVYHVDSSGIVTPIESPVTELTDADGDTYIRVEQTADDDTVRIGVAGGTNYTDGEVFNAEADLVGLFGLNASTGNTTGGRIGMFGGQASGTSVGGSITVAAGNSPIGAGGSVAISTGTGGTSSGQIQLTTADGATNVGGITIATGDSTAGLSGQISIVGGDSGGSSNAPSVFIAPGSADTGAGGGLQVNTGSSNGGNSGSVIMATAPATGTSNRSGSYIFGTGSADTDADVGDITFNLGEQQSTGNAGAVILANANTIAGQTVDLRFEELGSNGANYVGFKAPDAITANQIWTLPVEDGNEDAALVTDGSGVMVWKDRHYEVTFNATTDWGTASSGFYSIEVEDATHEIPNPRIVQVWELTGGAYELVTPDRVRVNGNGDVEFFVSETPDGRFAGRVVIS